MIFGCLAVVIGLTMCSMHPVLVGLALAGSFACAALVRGVRAACVTLVVCVPVVLVVAVVNVLVSAQGSTTLLQLGMTTYYVEALVYGLVSGCMLAAVILWFSLFSELMTSDRILALFGNVAPVVSLMVSMVLRLVPQFVSRGREASQARGATVGGSARSACGSESQGAARVRGVEVGGSLNTAKHGVCGRFAKRNPQVQGAFNLMNTLVGWGLEDSVVRGDSMRARGYESGVRRTTYQRYQLTLDDCVSLAAIVLVGVAAGVGAWHACAGFSFYPALPLLGWDWGFVAFGLGMFLPAVGVVKERVLWRN